MSHTDTFHAIAVTVAPLLKRSIRSKKRHSFAQRRGSECISWGPHAGACTYGATHVRDRLCCILQGVASVFFVVLVILQGVASVFLLTRAILVILHFCFWR